MTPEQAQELRKPFDQSVIGKLPRSTCKDCSNSQRRRCDNHQWVTNCPACHSSHSSATIHLDFVGHAAATDRLLKVDPEWTWEPLGLDPTGLPALDREGNLWIKLTICGVTRPGVGDGKTAKERIGDAIRNAAMRFGVALDLWAKEDLTPANEEPNQHDLKRRIWAVSRTKDPDLSDEERGNWIRGELEANGNDLQGLLTEWEKAA